MMKLYNFLHRSAMTLAYIFLATLAAAAVASCFWGCAPRRLVASSSSEMSQRTNNDIRIDKAVHEYLDTYFTQTLSQMELRDIEIRRFEFDTSAHSPKDSAGRGPILSETMIRDRSKVDATLASTATVAKHKSTDSTTHDQSTTQVDTSNSEDISDERGVSGFWWGCLAIATITVVIVVFKIIAKFK